MAAAAVVALASDLALAPEGSARAQVVPASASALVSAQAAPASVPAALESARVQAG